MRIKLLHFCKCINYRKCKTRTEMLAHLPISSDVISCVLKVLHCHSVFL